MILAAIQPILHMRENGDIIVTTAGWVIFYFFVFVLSVIAVGAWHDK